MSVLVDVLAELIGRVELSSPDRADLLSLLGTVESDRVDRFALDESFTDHESELDDGAAGITFTTVRQSRPSSVFIAWEGVQGVSGHGYYELQFSTSASEAGVVYTAQQQSTWHITDALSYGVTYYVRGRAVDAAGHVGAWGSWQTLQSLQTVTDDYADDSVTDVKIKSLTVGKLTAGTISSQEIILSNSTASILRSDNFAAGSAGWRIRGNGDAEFNNVTIRGNLYTGTGDAVEITGTSGLSARPGMLFIIGASAPAKPTIYASGNSSVIDLWLMSGTFSQTRGDGDAYIQLSNTSGGVSSMLLSSDELAFYGAIPQTRPSITGSRGGNAALANLLAALNSQGLITNNTTT